MARRDCTKDNHLLSWKHNDCLPPDPLRAFIFGQQLVFRLSFDKQPSWSVACPPFPLRLSLCRVLR
eukprot:726332-Prymnesium_polylepis.1